MTSIELSQYISTLTKRLAQGSADPSHAEEWAKKIVKWHNVAGRISTENMEGLIQSFTRLNHESQLLSIGAVLWILARNEKRGFDLESLTAKMIRMIGPLTLGELSFLVGEVTHFFHAERIGFYLFPYSDLMNLLERNIHEFPIPEQLNRQLEPLAQAFLYAQDPSELKKRLSILQWQDDKGIVIVQDAVGTEIQSFRVTNPDGWEAFIPLLQQAGKGSKPSMKWKKQVKAYLKEHQRDWESDFEHLINLTIQSIQKGHRTKTSLDVNPLTLDMIRGVVWAWPYLDSQKVFPKLEELTHWSFKKLPSIGALAKKIGNAGIYVFGQQAPEIGLPYLKKLKHKIKYPSVNKLIDKQIQQMANASDISMESLAEMTTPHFGLSYGKRAWELDEYRAILTLTPSWQVKLAWETPAGKRQKTLPKTLATTHKEEIKAIKKTAKEVKEQLAIQTQHIQGMYLRLRKMDFPHWNTHFRQHPLVGMIAEGLIWRFESETHSIDLISSDGEWINILGEPVEPNLDEMQVSLWHPCQGTRQEVENWRETLASEGIIQPFVQVGRNLYRYGVETSHSDTHSTKFEGIWLQQHAMENWLKKQGWSYSLQGQWDSGNYPTKRAGAFEAILEVGVDFQNGETTPAGIFKYVRMGKLTFNHAGSPQDLSEIPPIIFSEIHYELYRLSLLTEAPEMNAGRIKK
ncbi:DUF4132 domain-containing protein [Pontibacter sp. G13]|uniref:DUF4132 domain-containing protein n=1 Tax=Pontibacter sp. G13 TaxID=3074898 RepID=UPI00288AE85B|nr:DUF4132 domain-containing protein [Pontibacter sp. G13]WNJ17761.1 DUF4132 domain-containing protein [Pontibacter sp. G13]